MSRQKIVKIASMMLLFLVVLSVSSSTSVYAWSLSTHSYIAKKALDLDLRPIASYSARLGSIIPDFFWYLRDMGLIDADTAYMLHGETQQSTVTLETTYLYTKLYERLDHRDYRLMYFVKGVGTHVYADIKVHDPAGGYVEGVGMWVDTLMDNTGITDRETLHLALEFAVDSIIINKYGSQLPNPLFCSKQARFLEEMLEEVFYELGVTTTFDVSIEFRKYLSLMKLLEEVSEIYGSYLIKGEPSDTLLDLLDELSSRIELPQNYLTLLQVMLKFPEEIYSTLTVDGVHWEEAVQDAINFCREGLTQSTGNVIEGTSMNFLDIEFLQTLKYLFEEL